MQISMPGMMDTVLNLGLNDEVVAGLASKSGERFAYDSYRRFLDMFGNVVSSSAVQFYAIALPFLSFPLIVSQARPQGHVKLPNCFYCNRQIYFR